MDSLSDKYRRDKSPSTAAVKEDWDLTTPFYFSSIARENHQDLKVGDYVSVRGLPSSDRFQILDVSPKEGTVRVRGVDGSQDVVVLWSDVEPYKPRTKSKAMTHDVGNWLFGGSRVYMLSEPEKMLKTVRINWDANTCDLEDESGVVLCNVSWDDLDFWDPIEFHFPDGN
jgi:hypothetical protein